MDADTLQFSSSPPPPFLSLLLLPLLLLIPILPSSIFKPPKILSSFSCLLVLPPLPPPPSPLLFLQTVVTLFLSAFPSHPHLLDPTHHPVQLLLGTCPGYWHPCCAGWHPFVVDTTPAVRLNYCTPDVLPILLSSLLYSAFFPIFLSLSSIFLSSIPLSI